MGELRRRAVHVLGALVPGGYLLDDALALDLVGWHHVQALLVAVCLFLYSVSMCCVILLIRSVT